MAFASSPLCYHSNKLTWVACLDVMFSLNFIKGGNMTKYKVLRDQNGYLDAYVVKFGRTLTGIKFDSTRMIAGNAPFQHDDEVIVSSWCLLSKG